MTPLNPHLINLLSVREKQKLESTREMKPSVPPGAKSFTETLEESIAAGKTAPSSESSFSDAVKLAQDDAARQIPEQIRNAAAPRLSSAQVMNPKNLLNRFIIEQDLLIAAQRLPDARYRINPDDDTSGEAEVAANIQPID
ncbi:MAG: hypothetical protein O3A46_11570 [Candidatus Poribacteria bacterium]|nr:hypothetical protein [Candidatus Poribacteria bacterium]